MLAVLLLSSSAHAATEQEIAGLTPDSYFYFLDQFAQWVDLKLTFNLVKKVEKRLQYANEKIAEMKVLEESSKLDKTTVDALQTDYGTLTSEASSTVATLKSDGQDVAELVKKLEEQSSEHTSKFENLLSKAPEEAKDALKRALEMSKKGHEHAIEALSKELEEGNIKEEELDEDVKMDIRESDERRPGKKVGGLEIEDDSKDVSKMLNELDQHNTDAGATERELNNL